MKKIFLILFLVGALLTACLDLSTEPQLQGTITGKVTIGPLCPVEPCDLTTEQIYAAYDARKILVYDGDTVMVLYRIGIGHDSIYTAKLPIGTYVVDIDRSGIDHSGDVPQKVKILPSDTVTLDINIDTGIR